MPLLRLTRGLPAAGKTTLARAWVAQQPDGRARVNRDDLRAMLMDRAGLLDDDAEARITTAAQALVEALLRAGTDVVVDDTHLVEHHVRQWGALAARCGADVELVEVDTGVETCVQRDAARRAAGGRGVGAEVIRELARGLDSPGVAAS